MKMLKMIRKNRKKLDNKGFTLIELLAVIVILAIVMGLAANSVINSINNSRKSTLYSSAQAAANSLNTWVTEDSVASSTDRKTLSNGFIDYTQTDKQNEWICLKDLKNASSIKTSNNESPTVNYKGGIIKALGLSEDDIVLDGTSFTSTTDENGVKKYKDYSIQKGDKIGSGATSTTVCSAIRYNSSIDSYEVFLVAKNRGKFYVAADGTHYAFSRATGANVAIETDE